MLRVVCAFRNTEDKFEPRYSVFSAVVAIAIAYPQSLLKSILPIFEREYLEELYQSSLVVTETVSLEKNRLTIEIYWVVFNRNTTISAIILVV